MLYNKFRPITFNEMKGQSVNKQILSNQIKMKNISHAYIFHGLHGSGKTTSAKILAKAINCEDSSSGEPCNKCSNCIEFNEGRNPDVFEIDAASNNKVDDVSKIKEKIEYSPTRNKFVFILDEAHMLSKSAWNSLLTTIENEDDRVVFIFCSTELQKFPQTILSRCMKLSFTAIPEKDILDNLIKVCKEEKFVYEETGLKLLSKVSNGSMRDALSHLEKCTSYGDLTELNISNILGVVDKANTFEIIKKIMTKDIQGALKLVDDLAFLGKDMYTLAQDILNSLRDIYIYNITKNVDLISSNLAYVSSFNVNNKEVSYAINQFYKTLDILNKTDNKKVILEITLMELSSTFSNVTINDFDFSLKNVEVEKNTGENVKVNENKEEQNNNGKLVQENKDTLKKEDKAIKTDTQNSSKENIVPINHYDYLSKKIELIESYDINEPILLNLLNSIIYTTKKAFIIKPSRPLSEKGKQDIVSKMNEICKVKLNILFR